MYGFICSRFKFFDPVLKDCPDFRGCVPMATIY
jgi:hypothetical protein